jgi:spoIIIJ-associated protein
MREVEKSAASVEEAIEAALEELGISEQEADVQIVQEPRGGFIGLGSQQAVVRVRAPDRPVSPVSEDADEADEAAAPEPYQERSEPDEDLDQQADLAADLIENLLDAMGLDADVDTGMVDGVMYVDVWASEAASEGMGVLIGRHGQTLDALQEVVRGAVHQQVGTRCRVTVDVEDYRKRRRSQIVSRARGVARRVKESGKPESLEPMTALERKVVHDAVGEIGGVETASEGEEPERYVVIRRAVSRET